MTRFWRYYTMITSAICAEIFTFCLLWFGTNCMIFTVLFWMIVVAGIVAGTVWWLTDPQRKPWSPKQVPFQKLDESAYGHHDGYIERKEARDKND